MDIAEYDLLQHYGEVASLWERTLGDCYPVTHRVLLPRIGTRISYEPGDGMVAVECGRVVGFGINEVDRAPLGSLKSGGVQAILVDPAYQRRGIGSDLLSRLEARLKRIGLIDSVAGTGLYRFWSGIPDDLPAARTFFESHGYQSRCDAIDMVASLDGFHPEECYAARLRDSNISAEHATGETVGAIYDLLTREAPNWRTSMLAMTTAGDMDNVLVFRHEANFIGCIQTFTPQSRFRSANIVWERRYGKEMGGFGAVLIAKSWRGRGLGTCLCQEAANHVKFHGGKQCYIDWTTRERASLYAKVGAVICNTFHMYGKKL